MIPRLQFAQFASAKTPVILRIRALGPALKFSHATIRLNLEQIIRSGPTMLLSRDFVGYMAKEVVKRLVAGKMIETKDAESLAQQVRQVMADEVTVEDRLSEEAREILSRYSEEMRRTGVSYQDMYKKVKSQLARERKLILR
jgi:glycosyltransferase involved in cell wall biosynthesis